MNHDWFCTHDWRWQEEAGLKTRRLCGVTLDGATPLSSQTSFVKLQHLPLVNVISGVDICELHLHITSTSVPKQGS